MKAVLISIQPKWCEKIANGEKTIEVRKSRPKLETPFKVYIYCTNGTQLVDVRKEKIYLDINKPFLLTNGKSNNVICSTPPQVNRKVIGEFVCDRIDEFAGRWFGDYTRPFGTEAKILRESCLTLDELTNYLSLKNGYAWHISDLKIYDKPKELSEFEFPKDNIHLSYRKRNQYFKGITRPPQSWCYVEELQNGDNT